MIETRTHYGLERLAVEDDLLVIYLTSDIFSRVGNIKNVDLPEEGDEVDKGDELATITGTEEDLHLKAPISGVILEVNELFLDNLSKHKEKSEGSEWIIKIEPLDTEDLFGFDE